MPLASFDAEATALSIEQLGNYDAFVVGRVTYEKFYANWGHITSQERLENGSVILTYAPG